MDSFYFTLSTTLIIRSNRSCHKDPIMCVCVSPTQMDIHAVHARLASGSLLIMAVFYVKKEIQIKRAMAFFLSIHTCVLIFIIIYLFHINCWHQFMCSCRFCVCFWIIQKIHVRLNSLTQHALNQLHKLLIIYV